MNSSAYRMIYRIGEVPPIKLQNQEECSKVTGWQQPKQILTAGPS